MQIQQDIAQIPAPGPEWVKLQRPAVGGFGFREALDRAQHHAEIRQDGGIRHGSSRTLQQRSGRCRITVIEFDYAEHVQCGRVVRILSQQMFGEAARCVRVTRGIKPANVPVVVIAPPSQQGAIRSLDLSRQSGRVA
jgi:hypothetical protein